MRSLLEIREMMKKIYGKYDVYILPVVKLLIAMAALFAVNKQLGYMARINSTPIVLIVSLLCSFLPMGFIIFFAAVFILLHCYALSLEVALVALCLFFVMALLYFRFAPKDALAVVLTPLLFGLKIPYFAPLAMGLIGTPASAVSVGCGVVVHYFIKFISINAASISAIEEGEMVARLRLVIDGILDNKEMVVVIATFAFVVVLVYIIRRLSIDYAWTVAIIGGAFVNVVILIMGDLMYDVNISVAGVLLGTVVSVGLCMVLQFFVLCVDYTRTEKVQFEDDEYYYYVKAVPKMTVAAPEKNVKRINAQIARSTHPGNIRQTVNNANGQRTPGRQAPSRTISPNHQGYADRQIDIGEDIEDIEEI